MPRRSGRQDARGDQTVLLLVLAVAAGSCVVWVGHVGPMLAGRPPSADVVLHRIDVNRAGPAELQLLPHVGPAVARRIIAERQVEPFADLADLRRVKGIGRRLPDRLAPWVRFSPP
jgi:DNA uptake protein ComE-like DNA-binding protein